MADKKKNRKKKANQSKLAELGATVDDIRAAVADSITEAVDTIEDAGKDTKHLIEDTADHAADTVRQASGNTKQFVAATAQQSSGTAQALLEKVQPDHKSGKKGNKKDKQKKGKKK